MLFTEECQLINEGGPRVGEITTLQLPLKEVIWQEHQTDAKVLGSPLVTRKVPGEQEEVQRERQRGVRNHRLRASLVAQWLRVCLLMQGTRV